MRSLLFFLAIPLFAVPLRLGIVGTDTSHAVAFTRVLNDPANPNHLEGARIVAAWKGGAPDIKESAERIDRFAAELHDKWRIPFVRSIPDLCPLVDGLLLETIDGRQHLSQFRQALQCAKPIFIDKPLASTLADVHEIALLAGARRIPWFSASSLRYSSIAGLRTPNMTSALVWAPGPFEPHQQLDLAWYGIHGIEMLYTLFGPGCVKVSRISSPDSDVLTGLWPGGRLGTVHLQRPYGKYGAIVYLKNRDLRMQPDISVDYVPLVKQILIFMQTKIPPVPNTETLEIYEFMDAAQRSQAQNGVLMEIPSTATRKTLPSSQISPERPE